MVRDFFILKENYEDRGTNRGASRKQMLMLSSNKIAKNKLRKLGNTRAETLDTVTQGRKSTLIDGPMTPSTEAKVAR